MTTKCYRPVKLVSCRCIIQKSNGQAVFILCLEHTRLLELIVFFLNIRKCDMFTGPSLSCFTLYKTENVCMYVGIGHYSQAIMSIKGDKWLSVQHQMTHTLYSKKQSNSQTRLFQIL